MAPNTNIRWLPSALLATRPGGPQSQYRWPPEALILSLIHEDGLGPRKISAKTVQNGESVGIEIAPVQDPGGGKPRETMQHVNGIALLRDQNRAGDIANDGTRLAG
ncbi:hypothetical protein EDD25_2890 [Cryobacterium psychrophilum]|nr:hypothetical protein EDD25_2890 [Cryobacterium psychrophilum]